MRKKGCYRKSSLLRLTGKGKENTVRRRSGLLAGVILLGLAGSAAAEKLVLVAGGGQEAGGGVAATQAKLGAPFGVVLDAGGNLLVVEMTGHRVGKIDGKGTLTILAGNGQKGDGGDGGPGPDATFNGMHGLAVAPDGTVYLADTWNNRIRKLDP